MVDVSLRSKSKLAGALHINQASREEKIQLHVNQCRRSVPVLEPVPNVMENTEEKKTWSNLV